MAAVKPKNRKDDLHSLLSLSHWRENLLSHSCAPMSKCVYDKYRGSLSIYHTHNHSLKHMSERGEALSIVREITSCGDHLFYFQVLMLPLVLILSLRKSRVFLLYGFLEENSLCLLSLVFIAVHVILSDKIIRSYFLIDKNLTWYQS